MQTHLCICIISFFSINCRNKGIQCLRAKHPHPRENIWVIPRITFCILRSYSTEQSCLLQSTAAFFRIIPKWISKSISVSADFKRLFQISEYFLPGHRCVNPAMSDTAAALVHLMRMRFKSAPGSESPDTYNSVHRQK